MKNLSIYLFAFLALTLSMTSCKKDNDLEKEMEELEEIDDIVDNPQTTHFFSYTIGDVTHTAQGILAYGIDDEDDNVVRAYGVSVEFEEAMYIEIPKGLGSGTYAIFGETFSVLSVGDLAYSTYFGSPSIGEVTIAYETDGTLSGEFNFRLYNSDEPTQFLDVVDGKFHVQFRD